MNPTAHLLAASVLCSLAFTSCRNVPFEKLPPGSAALAKCHSKPCKHEWTTSDGIKLPFLKSLPTGKPKAVVIHVPGWDAVTGDYDSLTEALTAHGYAVYGSENRSFIYGPEKSRGNPRDWKPWVEDLKSFTKHVRAEQPGARIVWHGQSFGAVEALAAMANAKGDEAPDAMLLHSPAYAMLRQEHGVAGWVAKLMPWWRIKHIRLMDGGFPLNKRVDISTDRTWTLRWMWSEDRVREGYALRFLLQSVEMGKVGMEQASKLRVPVLGMWGGADLLGLGGDEKLRGDYDAFMRNTLSGSATERFYAEKSGHMMHEGAGSRQSIQKVINWLGTL